MMTTKGATEIKAMSAEVQVTQWLEKAALADIFDIF
jgi:hypothetical protein